MKVGLIRCIQTEDMCPATVCLKVMKEKRLAFDGITEDIEVIGINTCGGSPGSESHNKSDRNGQRRYDTIVLASCIFKGTPIGFPCPHAQAMKDSIVAETWRYRKNY